MLYVVTLFIYFSVCFFFFFFKQKTAYEMRISDWSSDVCSSDLPARCTEGPPPQGARRPTVPDEGGVAAGRRPADRDRLAGRRPAVRSRAANAARRHRPRQALHDRQRHPAVAAADDDHGAEQDHGGRSGERRVGKEWVITCRSQWTP